MGGIVSLYCRWYSATDASKASVNTDATTTASVDLILLKCYWNSTNSFQGLIKQQLPLMQVHLTHSNYTYYKHQNTDTHTHRLRNNENKGRSTQSHSHSQMPSRRQFGRQALQTVKLQRAWLVQAKHRILSINSANQPDRQRDRGRERHRRGPTTSPDCQERPVQEKLKTNPSTKPLSHTDCLKRLIFKRPWERIVVESEVSTSKWLSFTQWKLEVVVGERKHWSCHSKTAADRWC